MKRFGSIYLITNLIDGRQYVGQTKNNVFSRFNDHCRDKRSSRYLSSSIQFHGRENFIIEELVSTFDENTLNELESYYIKFYNTIHPLGYNLSLGGHNRGVISEKTRLIMREKKLGKKVNRTKPWAKDSRARMSKIKKGQPFVAINIDNGNIKHYDYISLAEDDGFSNGDIYRVLRGERTHVKRHKFIFLKDYVNQSGSAEIKQSEHAQRIEFEPANKAE